jgi:hypothetical protein
MELLVLAVTSGGSVSTFQLSSKDSSGVATAVGERSSASEAGNLQSIMGDLLSSIGKLSDNLSTVNSTSRIYDKILEQLAFAGLLQRCVSVQSNVAGSVPVQCHVDPVVTELGSGCTCGVAVRLINNCSFVFDAGWSAVVTVYQGSSAVGDSARANGAACDVGTNAAAGLHECVTRDLAGFSPGMSETIVLNLDVDGPLSHGLPITVAVTLIYAPQLRQTDTANDSVVIRLSKRTIDVLDVLRPVSVSRCRQSAAAAGFSQNCHSLVTVCRPHYGCGAAKAYSSDVAKLLAECSASPLSSKQCTLHASLPAHVIRPPSQGSLSEAASYVRINFL